MGFFKVVKMIEVIMMFIVPLTTMAEMSGGSNKEKKEEVLAKLKAKILEMEFTPPGWIANYWDLLLSMLVDVVVGIINKTNFFDTGSK